MDGVLELLHKRATTQSHNEFVVHPPRIVLNDPSILKSDDAVARLKNSIFSVVFQDGTAKMLSLPELLAFVFSLIPVAQQVQEVGEMISAGRHKGTHTVNISYQISMYQIMQPEMAKALLDKVSFSEVSSD